MLLTLNEKKKRKEIMITWLTNAMLPAFKTKLKKDNLVVSTDNNVHCATI